MKISLAPLVFAGACAAPVESITAIEQGALKDPECEDWQCGTNSPVIANYGFWDLNVAGLPNKQGFAIEKFVDRYANKYTLEVVGGRIIGHPLAPNLPVLEHLALNGARLYISFNGETRFVIDIRVEQTTYWAKVGGTRTVPLETYLFRWSELSNGEPKTAFKNVCKNATTTSQLGMNGLHTTVFEGERIKMDRKEIDAKLDTDWFNLGCAGSALAKLQLLGHTHAAQQHGFSTTIPQRQAALKMFAADYCGDGTPFTVAGQVLDWKDDAHTFSYSNPSSIIEARWTEDGASCLRVPRVVAHPSLDSMQAFPNGVMSEIAAHCELPPPCVGTGFDGHHLVSANPP